MSNMNTSPTIMAVQLANLNESYLWYEDIILDWLASLKSDRTRRAYRTALATFEAFHTSTLAEATSSDILSFARAVKENRSQRTGRPYSEATINSYLSALSSFFQYCVECGLRVDNPCRNVKYLMVKQQSRIDNLKNSGNHFVYLLEAIDRSTRRGKRDYAIILLLLTGTIEVELIARLQLRNLKTGKSGLQLDYINLDSERRQQTLPPETAEAIRAYLAARDNLAPNLGLFVASKRQSGKPLTARAILDLVRKRGDQAFGQGHGITPRTLRSMAEIKTGISSSSSAGAIDHSHTKSAADLPA